MSTSFPILDLILGLIFLFFLLSIITSSGVELVITIVRARAWIVKNWLRDVFNQPALNANGTPAGNITIGQAIMNHCLTKGRTTRNQATPYISPANFVTALLDKITISPAATGGDSDNASDPSACQPPPATLQDYVRSIGESKSLSGELKRSFLMFANEAALAAAANTSPLPGTAKSDLDLFKAKLENWYTDMQDRFTDRLKRGWTVWLTAVIGAATVVCMNVDAVAIAKYLYKNEPARTALANAAQATAIDTTAYQARVAGIQRRLDSLLSTNSGDTSVPRDSVPRELARIQAASKQFHDDIATLKAQLPKGLPIGYDRDEKEGETLGGYVLRHIGGWLLTILAIMLGAPFWFDMLNRVANIRGTGPKPTGPSGIDGATPTKPPR